METFTAPFSQELSSLLSWLKIHSIPGTVGLFLLGSYVLMQLYLAFLVRRENLPTHRVATPLPVLIAVRNEAQPLPLLIQTLERQSVGLQALFGEDNSTDETPILLEAACQKHPSWDVIPVPQELHTQYPGKQAVLVALEQAVPPCEVFLATDADMILPSTWAEGLTAALRKAPEIGGVCGPSLPKAHTLWEGFQRVEWANTLYLIAANQARGHIVTAIGNSLALRRIAWETIGGWKSLKPTLVEDYALLRALERAGWRFRWVFHPAVFAETRTEKTFRGWLHQRLRWRHAAQNLPLLASLYWAFQSLLPWSLLATGAPLLCWIPWIAAEALPLWRLRQTLSTQKILRYLPLLLLYRFVQGGWLLWLRYARRPFVWRNRLYS
ncbi:MAG: glycosyltransferase [Bacteroidia bacterium]|jgi:cellulose synthase/poly-beta-1,6-N-acetylglucosamine synthase-like glycosyltransferase|nr:glycosyltransferase [Bacteroidia bacterium]GIV22822.1 MAG: hypothetical protein KatS3mg025_0481 [Bacteroidia bacterium]